MPAPPRWTASSWHSFLLVWLIALIVLAANDPGKMIFDTKLGVDIDPAGFYARLWPLWNPLEWLGTLQDQYIGYAIPMGPFFLIGQVLRMPVWITERLWLSLIVAVGYWGITKLAAALGIGSEPSRVLAGVVFALSPAFTIVIGSTSAGALPGLLVPWAVLPLVSGLRGERSLASACARSGVAVLLMGGVNAVVTLAVLVLPAVYILTHARGRRRIAVLAGWSVAVVAATAWWAIPLLLQGHYSFNFLPYVEQSGTTTETMSATAFLRGAGDWTAYFNLGAPWLSAGWEMVANRSAILASAAVAAAGLAGLARRDMPERLWTCLSLAVAALAMVGYHGPLGGPLHGLAGTLLNGALAPFRNVSKFEPVVAVVLALGLAHGIGLVRLPALRPLRQAVTAVIALVVTASLAGLGLPYVTDQVLQPGSFTRVPAYWSATAAFLAAHSPRQTALVVPGTSHGIYLWGEPIDEPLEPLASSPWTERALVPFGGPGSQDFLSTAETAIESGQDVPGLAAYLQRAGIRYVVVRNDLSSSQIGYVQPTVVLATLRLSGFQRVASFGPMVTGAQTNPSAASQVQAYLPSYPAVEIFQAASAALRGSSSPVSALPVSATAFVNGGPDSLLQLDGQGVLGDQAAVIAGDALAGQPALWAVTDGQRRADNAFGLVNANTTYTYTATGTNPVDDSLGGAGGPPRQLLPVSAAGHQTVAVLHGAASVTASSFGTWLTYEPQFDPVNAFDGNSATAWAEGDPTSPLGQWIQITFDQSLVLPGSVGIQLLNDAPNRAVITKLQVSTAAGTVTTAMAPTAATQQLLVPPGPTTWLRITIVGAANDTPGDPGAGISEVLIPGVTVTRYLQPAESSAGAAAPSVAFSFHQSPPAPAGTADPGATVPIARTFTLDQPEQLALSLSAVAQPSAGLDSLLGSLAPPGTSSLLVSASSTWGSLPIFGPDNLFTTSSEPWISGSTDPSLTLMWQGDRDISKIAVRPAFGFTAAPPQILVTTPSGASEQAFVGLGGVATLQPALTTDQMTISFPGWAAATTPTGAGDAEAFLALAKLDIPALRGLFVGGPTPSTPFSLACGQGPAVTLDGQAIQTSVSGTLGDLTDGLPVQVQPCTEGGTVTLGSGTHQLLASPGVFTMTDVTLRGQAAGSPASAGAVPASTGPASTGPARTLSVLSWQADNRSVRIGPGQESYVEVHQNADPGWVATLDGRRLTPAVLDGWQQAFIVPTGAGGVITMTFAPAGVYHTGLILSALAVAGLLGVAVAYRRGRSRPRHRGRISPRFADQAPAQQAVLSTEMLTAGARWGGLLAVTALIGLLGGLVALAVPVLSIVAALRPRVLPLISLAALLAAGVIAAAATSPTALGTGAFGADAQVCALVALAAALYPSPPDQPRHRRGW